MATRKQAREAVIQILYARELGNERAIEQAEYFLNEQKIRNKQQEFALNLLHGVCSKEHEIVQVMNVFLKTWDIGRLGIIEKNILKLGIYELQQTSTQQAVVINEAIELTKSFNVQDAFRLVNGVLDSVAKTDSETLAKLTQEYEQSYKNKQATNQHKIVQQEVKPQKTSQKTKQEKNEKAPHFKNNEKKVEMKQKVFKYDNETQIRKKTKPEHIKSVKLTSKNNQQNLSQKENKDEKYNMHKKNNKNSNRVKIHNRDGTHFKNYAQNYTNDIAKSGDFSKDKNGEKSYGEKDSKTMRVHAIGNKAKKDSKMQTRLKMRDVKDFNTKELKKDSMSGKKPKSNYKKGLK